MMLLDGTRLVKYLQETHLVDDDEVAYILDTFGAGGQTPMSQINPPTKALVIRHGRATSWEAALGQTSQRRQRMYRLIYKILSQKALTDHEIRIVLERNDAPHSWSGVSARRVELVRAGWVRDTGRRRKTQFGKPATVWAAVPELTN